jgi:23S rRNA pseudouridine1911/1915/1917 synthase
MQTWTVSEELNNERIDNALAELMSAYSRSMVQKMVRKELVTINGKIAKKGNRVKIGDKIGMREMKLEDSKFLPTEIPLDIIYEDDDLIIINKPPGLLTHPSAREREYTLVNALLHHCGDRLSGIGGEKRPGIVHRLDKNTSGILMVAKHDESHRDLAKQIQERRVEKHYLALVNGLMASTTGTIEAPLLKSRMRGQNKVVISPGKLAKDSLTHYKVKEVFEGEYSLLEVQIITGRMHQIRVHLTAIGHPVLGDELYGNKKSNESAKMLGLTRQFLHAYSLKFQHPRTHEWMEFTAPLPDDLATVLAKLKQES